MKMERIELFFLLCKIHVALCRSMIKRTYLLIRHQLRPCLDLIIRNFSGEPLYTLLYFLLKLTALCHGHAELRIYDSVDGLLPVIFTHLTLDRMAPFLADGILKCIFLNEKDKIAIQISLKFVPRSPVDNNPALVRVMAWRRIGDKPLPEWMMVQFTDAYVRGFGEMSFKSFLTRKWDMSPWWPLLKLPSWYLSCLSSHCNSSEDRVPEEFISGYPIFKCVAMTWQKGRTPVY